ncbi:MAG: NADH-quinone oxidoreductase subunit A [Candidatus Latescibacterota bacterium]|nr:MAG: NADH-quinone oxidoreductase subunit A [Candidatus Latescibacterota bacterium]
MPLGLKYSSLVILFVLSVAIPLALVGIASLAGPKRPTTGKHTPFESGIHPVGDARRRFSVKFFLVALLFLIFDVEVIFVFPWAVLFRHLGLFGFIEMTVFLVILLLGLFYVWRKGALEWE